MQDFKSLKKMEMKVKIQLNKAETYYFWKYVICGIVP